MVRRRHPRVLFLAVLPLLSACSGQGGETTQTPAVTDAPTVLTSPGPPSGSLTPHPTPAGEPTQAPPAHATPGATPVLAPSGYADVVSVKTTGTPGDYTFAVTLHSPDTGCEQYADWWEVLDEQGSLLYRRILNHSHPDEQPFTRTGGPVPVESAQKVIVRGHMNTTGYGGQAMSGTVEAGFSADAGIGADFAPDAASLEPQPDGCAF